METIKEKNSGDTGAKVVEIRPQEKTWFRDRVTK